MTQSTNVRNSAFFLAIVATPVNNAYSMHNAHRHVLSARAHIIKPEHFRINCFFTMHTKVDLQIEQCAYGVCALVNVCIEISQTTEVP